MLGRCGAWIVSLVWVLGATSACWLGGGRDLLVERCTEVIHYRHPALRELVVIDVLRGPGASAVTLEFEALAEPSGEQVSSRIACEFEGGEPWALERIQIDGRALTEAEIVLVNAELLLRDLSRSPERLERGLAPRSS